jgi:UDP-N-acetylglucosamine diphosphorylase/glucosamine-1-phosphate N-acetyltransferase
MNNLTITIMAAGEGKRMNSNIPKVLHLFNKIPMLIRIILEVIKLNCNKIIIITGKYDELIKKTIYDYFNNNNIKYSFDNLIFIKQNIPSGTGDAIKCSLDKYNENEYVLILNGDMPLITSDLILEFISSKDNAKLLVNELDNPCGYGRIIIKNNKFIEIKEDKDCTLEEKNINIVNAGIYLFHSSILIKYIPLINNNNAQNEYYLTDIIKLIREKSNIDISIHKINNDLKYMLLGINTKDELENLENFINNKNLF